MVRLDWPYQGVGYAWFLAVANYYKIQYYVGNSIKLNLSHYIEYERIHSQL